MRRAVRPRPSTPATPCATPKSSAATPTRAPPSTATAPAATSADTTYSYRRRRQLPDRALHTAPVTPTYGRSDRLIRDTNRRGLDAVLDVTDVTTKLASECTRVLGQFHAAPVSCSATPDVRTIAVGL